MMLASQILLIIAAILLLFDAALMFAHRPNPLKGLPLPCPITLVILALGILLFSISQLLG